MPFEAKNTERLDRDSQAVVDALNAAGSSELGQKTPAEVRDWMKANFRPYALDPKPPVAAIEAFTVPTSNEGAGADIPVRLYRPTRPESACRSSFISMPADTFSAIWKRSTTSAAVLPSTPVAWSCRSTIGGRRSTSFPPPSRIATRRACGRRNMPASSAPTRSGWPWAAILRAGRSPL
jgi:hypothetical protein